MLRFVTAFINFVCIVTIVCYFAVFHCFKELDLRKLINPPLVLKVYPGQIIPYISYRKGDDYIICDVQITKDLKLICSHEAWINEVCGVENHIEFSNRIRSYNFDDDNPNFNWILNDKEMIENHYFTIDFTLEELRTLKRNQTSPTRDPYYNRRCSFNSFDEFVIIAKSHDFGISMKLKSQSALNKILKDRNHETTVQKMVIDSLKEHGYTDPNAKCHFLSFELSILEEIKDQTKVNCLFLIAKTDEETLK